MKLILRYIRRHLGIFLISTFFLTAEALADLLQPTFMSYIVDKGIKNADIKIILHYGLIMLLIAALGACSAVMRNRFASQTSQTIGKELRCDMYHKIQTLSQENIDRLQPSSLITRLTNDVTQIQNFINSIMRMMVKAPITCVGAIILIMLQTPKQAPVIALILVIVSLLIAANMNFGYPKFSNVQNQLDRLNDTSRGFLSSVRVVKAFRAESEEADKFESASRELAAANTAALQMMAYFTPLISLTVNFGIVVLLWLSQSQHSSEIGKLMASVNYMTQILFSVNMISNAINVAVRAAASSDRILEVLSEKPVQSLPDHPLRPKLHGAITFDHVSFSYAGSGQAAIQDLSLEIHAGETIGIIGPTGSGKTTLIHLVPRFYDVTQGTLSLDGHDITQIDTKLLREQISIVPQKALLFSGTIAENLRWGNRDAADEELYQAASIACADEFIQKTALGYDTPLGQGGVNLSGGQKQRIALARALVKKPKILILDDCTSALDAQTEYHVLNRLQTLSSHMTVLLISQRISTVMRADRILCLENGKIRGIGTHDELMAGCNEYRAIYTSQIGDYNYG